MRKFLLFLVVAVFTLSFSGVANAIPVTYDFTLAGGSLQQPSMVFVESGVTLTATGGIPASGSRDVYRGSAGLGVKAGSSESMEIDGAGPDEWLYLTFDYDVVLLNTTFSMVDRDDDAKIFVDGVFLDELGWNGDPNLRDIPADFTGFSEASRTGSVFAFTIAGADADDFMVADFTVDAAPVPEPGTIVLMGLGLVGLAGMGRKKLFKK